MDSLTEPQLREAIVSAFPELAASRFTLRTAGWDSVAVDVDDRLIFKFPRNEVARRRLVMEASLLAAVRPTVSLAVPDMRIHDGPPLFSHHEKLKGEHLLPDEYRALPDGARTRLAETMARFYADLHGLDRERMVAAGAVPVKQWRTPAEVRERALPVISPDLHAHAEEIVDARERLPPDPHGDIYGFFDGHGWNMAFYHAQGRLNGIYDFADSGFGPLHQEFVYTDFVSRDLTERVITAYESITARPLDRRRIAVLSGFQRLSEIVDFVDGPDHGDSMIRAFAGWAAPDGSPLPRGSTPPLGVAASGSR
jgi:Ser/Thr protein kinase RdoA (MazF antagonist)